MARMASLGRAVAVMTIAALMLIGFGAGAASAQGYLCHESATADEEVVTESSPPCAVPVSGGTHRDYGFDGHGGAGAAGGGAGGLPTRIDAGAGSCVVSGGATVGGSTGSSGDEIRPATGTADEDISIDTSGADSGGLDSVGGYAAHGVSASGSSLGAVGCSGALPLRIDAGAGTPASVTHTSMGLVIAGAALALMGWRRRRNLVAADGV